jgi:hypothetical protein
LDVVDHRADVTGTTVCAAGRETARHELDVPGIVEMNPVRSGQRVALQQPLGDRIALGAEPAFEDLERFRLADELDALHVADLADPVPELGDLRVGGGILDEDFQLDLVADLVRFRGRRPHDRDEHPEHERGDQHGREGSQTRGGIALQRPKRLSQEEDPHRAPFACCW